MMKQKRCALIFTLFILLAMNGCQPGTAKETSVLLSTPPPGAELTVTPPATATAVPLTIPPPSAVPPTAVSTGPRQIIFAPGADSGTVSGALTAGEEHEYHFFAFAGQWATIALTSTADEANFALSGMGDSQPYKRLVNEDRRWSGPLRATQEYHLRVKSMSATEYSLSLTIPGDLPPMPQELTALLAWTAQALYLGRTSADVQHLLYTTGWIEPDGFWQELDMDGDGDREVLLSIQDAQQMSSIGPQGDFAILGDGAVLYRHFARYTAEMRLVPSVATTLDITGDGLWDVVLKTEFCGAHTCTQEYEVLSAHEGAVAPLSGSEGPYTRIAHSYSDVSFADETGDGLPDILLHGGFIGSVGAGPYQRGSTQIWGWDSVSGQMELAETRLDPSNYRFHLLYEANDAFDNGDYQTAIAKYLQVIEDETLEDGEGLLAGRNTYDYSRQFAAFRLMLIYTITDNPGEISNWVVWLQTLYYDAPISQATAPFWEAHNATADVVNACATVTAYLQSVNNPTGPLADLGYALPYLTAETVCPLGE